MKFRCPPLAISWFVFSAVVSLAPCAVAAEVEPLPRAHAHNDYEHDRPLLDAMDQGFCGVEADIYLVDGKLLVAHNRRDVRAERTLQSLYLDPLRKLISENGGRVYPKGPRVTLLIDIKSEAEATYLALHHVLAEYAEILTVVDHGKVTPGPLLVVISGNRPHALVAAQDVRYAGVDGRISDLDSQDASHLLPMISDNWGRHFHWRGNGEMPAAEHERLKSCVDKAHAAGRMVRFWATPENENVWQALIEADVDLINTDELVRLRQFLLTQDASP